MIYEYRRYHVVPGKIGAMHARFRDLTWPLWEKAGIKPVAIWEATVGDTNVVHDLLQWESMAERQKLIDFQTSKEWAEVRAQTEKDGPLVVTAHNEIWTPVPYSRQAVKGLVQP